MISSTGIEVRESDADKLFSGHDLQLMLRCREYSIDGD